MTTAAFLLRARGWLQCFVHLNIGMGGCGAGPRLDSP